jgi:dinuclear metal center YbgI/SA1388 family protein
VPKLADVIAALDALYDPGRAEAWDAVGLVCGDPDASVERVLFAVDPVQTVVDEAVEWGADLVVTHHPLFLRPVHGVAATDPKGRVVHTLLSNRIGLHVAHTNADSADPGVSDALATAIGLTGLRPLVPQPADATDKLVVFVPEADAASVIDALAVAGAGQIGTYERCAWTTAGIGTFNPGEGSAPAIGAVGVVEEVPETRVEMVMPRQRRSAVLKALVEAHPYEEPAYDVYELASSRSTRGLGRVGTLDEPEPLSAFVTRVADALPATAAGVRAAGDPGASIQTVAVCGGAGDSMFGAVRSSGADAYVTADLRHHPASEAIEVGGTALVDVSHWASEWPWLADAQRHLVAAMAAVGTTVDTRVSTTPTDPWTLHSSARGGESH